MIISGYFSYGKERVHIHRFIKLLIQVSVFRLMSYSLNCLIDHTAISKRQIVLQIIPANYFVVTYVCVGLLPPYINLVLKRLYQRRFLFFLGMCLILFSVIPFSADVIQLFTGWDLSSLISISYRGSLNGYSLVNYTLMFITGAYLKKNPPSISTWKCILYLFLCWGLIFIGGYGYHKHGFEGLGFFFGYHNPAIIGSAAFLFLLFLKIDLGSIKWINILASGSISVYLAHRFFLARIDTTRYADGNILRLALQIAAICISLYLAGFFLHFIYETLYAFVQKTLFGRLPDWTVDLTDLDPN